MGPFVAVSASQRGAISVTALHTNYAEEGFEGANSWGQLEETLDYDGRKLRKWAHETHGVDTFPDRR